MVEALTRDGFLGGRLQLWQPRDGFRAGVDSVLLAAAVPAQSGDHVLELGCGPGVAAACLAARVPGLHVTGLEVQENYAELARRNGIDVVLGDVAAPPPEVRSWQADQVMANPPFLAPGSGTPAGDAGRAKALLGANLEVWVRTGLARLKAKGSLTLILRTERLPDILSAFQGLAASLDVLPLAGRSGQAPERFLLRARKNGRRPFRLLAPLVLHEGDEHGRDAPDYRPEIAAILSEGAALNWPPQA